jgi:hypothetical protein
MWFIPVWPRIMVLDCIGTSQIHFFFQNFLFHNIFQLSSPKKICFFLVTRNRTYSVRIQRLCDKIVKNLNAINAAGSSLFNSIRLLRTNYTVRSSVIAI